MLQNYHSVEFAVRIRLPTASVPLNLRQPLKQTSAALKLKGAEVRYSISQFAGVYSFGRIAAAGHRSG